MNHRMAILVDGAFYLKRAKSLKGLKTPQERANELTRYCLAHAKHENAEIYRIFYYDCDPLSKKVYHPLFDRTFDLSKTDDFKWKNEFFKSLSHKRKLAIRKGQELDSSGEYMLKNSVAKDLVRKKISVDELKSEDFALNIQQKGVDMRIGLDLALIAHEKFADQIVLITGDSDFVPAAKYARRHGIDFIVDAMWHPFREDLGIHTDGMYCPWPNPAKKRTRTIHR